MTFASSAIAPKSSPAGFSTHTLPLGTAYSSDLMDAHGTNSEKLHLALPAVADSSSRSLSRTVLTAFEWETTELGAAVDASPVVSHVEFNKKKQMGQATWKLGVAAVTSRLEGLEIPGDRQPTAKTTPSGGSGSRSTKSQAGDRSRFRPWGYI